jgi:hypothetical protein
MATSAHIRRVSRRAALFLSGVLAALLALLLSNGGAAI